MTAAASTRTAHHAPGFISLRVRLIIGAIILLTILLAGLGYWFIDFAVGQAYDRIQRGLNDTLVGASAGADGDGLAELAKLVPPFDENVDVKSEQYQQLIAPIRANPLYQKQLDWLATLHRIEPRGYGYTFVRGPKENEVIFIADVWSLDPNETNRKRATQFGEHYIPEYRAEVLMDAFKEITPFTIVDQSEIEPLTFAHPGNLLVYTDDWGTWVSSYAPVKNSAGEVVGGIGIDFEAAYVQQVRDSIVSTMGFAFILIYVGVIALVVIVARAFTGPILALTKTAELIGEGSYDQDLTPLAVRRYPDEISTLAGVFDIMIDKVAQRERNLRQQVEELKIMVDQTKRDSQVAEIVDSDFFQELTAKAKKIKDRDNSYEERRKESGPSGESTEESKSKK